MLQGSADSQIGTPGGLKFLQVWQEQPHGWAWSVLNQRAVMVTPGAFILKTIIALFLTAHFTTFAGF